MDVEFDPTKECEGAKQKLNELCQREKWPKPTYRVEKEIGPAHDRRFICSVHIIIAEGIPSGWPSGLNLGLPCWRSQVRNPLLAKARGLPPGSSSSHRTCLVWVTSPMWFASFCIGAGVLPCAHPKGSGCGFPLS